MKTIAHDQKNITRRLVALLNKEEIEFVNRLCTDAFFSTGKRLTKVDIIAALIDAAMELELSGLNANGRQGLAKKIISTAQEYTERRKNARIEKEFPVIFRPENSLDKYARGATKDICLSGLRIETDNLESLPKIDQILDIVIGDSTAQVRATGCVEWISKRYGPSGAKIGIRILYINEADREQFESYLTDKKTVPELDK